MASGVFVLKDEKTLVAMQPASFAKEDDFQQLLADFPSLLSGDLIDAATPRRWVLISREKSIPDQDGGGGRWSLDHLFVDQDGVPTLVEVKRQSDSRLRREVVGQMLDYAANAVVYWPLEELRREFEARCEAEDLIPEEEIRAKLGLDDGVEVLWQRLKTNLQAGRIRMLFVADHIPSELRRVVEFLNEQMDPAEVLALELRQFEGEGLKTLVPVLYGQTEDAQQKKAAGGPKRQWDEEAIYADMEQRVGADAVRVARQIGRWMTSEGGKVWFGSGKKDGSMVGGITSGGKDIWPLYLWSNGNIEVSFSQLMKSPIMDEPKRRQIAQRLNEIEGIKIAPEAITRWASLPLSSLADQKRLSAFLAVMSGIRQELRAV